MFATSTTAPERARSWAYVIAQLALLILLATLPGGDTWSVPPSASALGDVARLAGLVLLAAGLVSLGRSLSPFPAPSQLAVLKTRGAYALVRHPIYSGLILLAAVWAATSGSLFTVTVASALALLLDHKARWEEQRLLRHFDGYADYAARVGRLVPLIGRLDLDSPPAGASADR
ncbi:isoprenylcysteine carboxylmethyltransferase family protein [Iamia majanohamensis]|uniref:Isoprenylcysteine carboxylmethyltransferase family protein n=1 Tax=Iamia majanohamensis TaxID=467976 RepID=A0AAF0BUQ4_9ACTN|nr:isoprenylcysteine carboxylmethyltransferase family protein [Iamia majanohamensis]WCO66323.1 isoprenylcysteine carboxylmethyltransferase family protein [Iamia majanohamensis]